MPVVAEPEVAEAPRPVVPPATSAASMSAAPVADARSAIDAAMSGQSAGAATLAMDQPASLAPQPVTGGGGAVGGGVVSAGPSVEAPPSMGRGPLPPPLPTSDDASESARYRERPVKLPVTPRSDAAKQVAPATPAARGERPLAQLLVFALLIATIVLVSAAVGVVVGRWMAQR